MITIRGTAMSEDGPLANDTFHWTKQGSQPITVQTDANGHFEVQFDQSDPGTWQPDKVVITTEVEY